MKSAAVFAFQQEIFLSRHQPIGALKQTDGGMTPCDSPRSSLLSSSSIIKSAFLLILSTAQTRPAASGVICVGCVGCDFLKRCSCDIFLTMHTWASRVQGWNRHVYKKKNLTCFRWFPPSCWHTHIHDSAPAAIGVLALSFPAVLFITSILCESFFRPVWVCCIFLLFPDGSQCPRADKQTQISYIRYCN